MFHLPARPSVTFLGNASVLIHLSDAVVLTDPYFGIASQGITDTPALSPGDLPPLTAIIGSHWARDHWEIEALAGYGHKDTTAVFVADASMAESARRVGFTNVETLEWGQRRQLDANVELEVVPEHTSGDGMASNNYALDDTRVRLFYGGEVLDVDRISTYAENAPPFDVAIGPVNGVRFRGRQLVTTATEMAAVARSLDARTLIPIHDGHLAFDGLVEITSSSGDLTTESDLAIVHLAPGEHHTIAVERFRGCT